MLELKQKPVQATIPISRISVAMELVISGEIEALLNKGAVYEVSTDTEGFYSRIFVVPQKGGKHRPVINLRPLNRFLVYQHFKMEGIQLVRDLLQREDWLTRIDLKDTYFAVPIHQKHRKYLRFMWKGKAYEFQCLPFGLSSAPRVFTKLLRPVVGFLREKGVRCVIYLDDILLMEQSREVLRQHTALAVSLLESLGFLINYPKSHLEPSQLLEYLGFLVDTVKKELKLPKEKIERIKKEATSLLDQEAVSARILARVVGRMTAAVMAVYPAPLHYRALQRLKHKALHAAGYDGTIRVSPEARQDLNWWVDNLSDWNGREVAQRSPEISIETDASLLGWGAFCQGESSGGCWSPGEKLHHINWLELLAVFYALKANVKEMDVNSIVIRSDNTTVVAHLNKMGGTKSPSLVALTRHGVWNVIWKSEPSIYRGNRISRQTSYRDIYGTGQTGY